MSTCASCDAELRPEWKFCIKCGDAILPGAVRPDQTEPRRFNTLAILALILACLGGAPALVFGHIAIGQIKVSGERGMLIALIATGLGYFWLIVWAVVITLVVSGVWH